MKSQIKTMIIACTLFATLCQAYHVTDNELISLSENPSSFEETHQASESVSADAVEGGVTTHTELKGTDAETSLEPQLFTTTILLDENISTASIADISTIPEVDGDVDTIYTSKSITEEETINHSIAFKEVEANVSEEITNEVPFSENLFSTAEATATAGLTTAEESSFEHVTIQTSEENSNTENLLVETSDEMTPKEATATKELESQISVGTASITEILPTDLESENVASVEKNSQTTQELKEVTKAVFEEEVTQTEAEDVTEPVIEEEITEAVIEIETVSGASSVTPLPQVTGSETFSNDATELIPPTTPKNDAVEPTVNPKIEDHTYSLTDMVSVSTELTNIVQTETSELSKITEKLEEKDDEFLKVSKLQITKLRAAHSALAQAQAKNQLAQKAFDSEMDKFFAQMNSKPESA